MTEGAPERFDARGYWERRLADDWSLRGTGHICYTPGYNRWLYRAKRRAVLRALRGRRPGAALDVGSGVGWVVSLLHEQGWSVSGCDLTEVSVSRLAGEFPGTDFSVVDAGADPLPAADGSLDLVTVIDVAFHLVGDGQLDHLTREIARVLRPGGVAIVTDALGDHDERPEAHVRFRGLPTWHAALAGTGLEVVSVAAYFRLLSRLPDDAPLLRRLRPRLRGAIEYAADRWLPLPPHLRIAVLQRKA